MTSATQRDAKLTVEQIRQRFDGEVERFSNLETGQTAVMDAPLMLELVAQTAATLHPQATSLLDLGCGAGNYALKLLDVIPDASVTLVDLSSAMLTRARERVQPQTAGHVEILQGDLREVDLGVERFDVVTAGATLHHLRTDPEWELVFGRVFRSLKPGGSFWIIDIIEQSTPELQAMMWRRWGEYLTGMQDEAYRDKVFAYVDAEDTPHSLLFQLDLLRKVGFRHLEILHKTACFAAFGGIKSA